MNIQKKLSKLGIEKVEELNYKDINYISHYVANLMTKTFPFLGDKYNEIYENKEKIDEILKTGAERARSIAKQTLKKVRIAIGADRE